MLKAFKAGADLNGMTRSGGASQQSPGEVERLKLLKEEHELDAAESTQRMKELEDKLREKEYEYNKLTL